MSAISENSPNSTTSWSERPSFAQQKAAFSPSHEADCVSSAEQWLGVARLLDEFVSEYDAQLCEAKDDVPVELHRQLQRVLDGFDVLGSVARANAEVLDDLASEIILAQARVSTVWTDYLDERSRSNPRSARSIERRFAARSTREVWYPFDGAVEGAARRLRTLPALDEPDPAAISRDDPSARVVTINRVPRR